MTEQGILAQLRGCTIYVQARFGACIARCYLLSMHRFRKQRDTRLQLKQQPTEDVLLSLFRIAYFPKLQSEFSEVRDNDPAITTFSPFHHRKARAVE